MKSFPQKIEFELKLCYYLLHHGTYFRETSGSNTGLKMGIGSASSLRGDMHEKAPVT
jgi:hypothetical protein